MNCSEAITVMHEYFDGEADAAAASALKKHLETCPSCRRLFKQMESTEAMLRVPVRSTPPVGLTESIMSSLPQPAKRSRWGQMLKQHPIAVIACAILVIMLAHYTSRVYSDRDMVVQGALDQLFISGDTLVVPEGVTVYGNLKVKRGKIQIDGNVEGDVTVINGSYNLASTAYISGQVTMIDAAVDRLWYRIKNMFRRFPKKDALESPSFPRRLFLKLQID
ncbi:MAG: anti-sigma factor [Paenibacillaceae bacterium]|jgi:predicted anti-sigma-YlaC factor YlaD|nr:anti-sigma factor [Paenibacillaceae bacterium]